MNSWIRLSFSKDMSAWNLERGALELSARIDEAVSGCAKFFLFVKGGPT